MSNETTADELCFMPAVELAERYRRREISPVEVLDAVLDRIERLNPKVNAFVTLVAEQAREQAKVAARDLISTPTSDLPRLHGIPVTVKDLTPTAGVRTTFGHPMFADHVPDEDSAMWARLKSAGAILVGKTTTPAFGGNSVTESEVSGITNNPWDLSRTVGGSSGGAATAAVSGFGPLATGSDGGGSIRVPASFCGAVGLKASTGRIPMYGEESSMETVGVVGPITRTVADNALMLTVVAGPHPYEPFTLLETGVDYVAALEGASFQGLRIAFSPDLGRPPVAHDVRSGVRRAVDSIDRDLGAHVDEVEITLPDPIQYFMDYWGPYAAQSVAESPELEADFLARPTAARYLRHAQAMSAADLMHVQHVVRAELHRAFADVFLNYDLLIWPTTTTTAFPHPGDAGGPTVVDGHPVEVPSLENQRLTEAISHACYPAISIPAGFNDDGLPIGLQIAAGHGQDAAVLRAAAAFESAHPWADRRPPIR
jgi:Asp-tRNA(Asn)/Glu-tRNA(Gln) amidotransferase A subunit family amidase